MEAASHGDKAPEVEGTSSTTLSSGATADTLIHSPVVSPNSSLATPHGRDCKSRFSLCQPPVPLGVSVEPGMASEI